MIRKILCATGLLAIMLCSGELKSQSTEPTAKELINQAESTRKEADSIGFEWSSTASLIKNAQAALDAGKEDDARQLANKALLEGQQALLQGQYMKNNWQSFIPKP